MNFTDSLKIVFYHGKIILTGLKHAGIKGVR